MPVIRKDSLPEEEIASSYPAPHTLPGGQLFVRRLSDSLGMDQFGATLERLVPGGRSSLLHWHEKEDELLLLLSGQLTVIEGEEEHILAPGDAAGWKAGVQVGHTIRNDGAEDAVFFLVGTRFSDEVCHYPGLDLIDRPEGYQHLDGTPYSTDTTYTPGGET